MEQEVLFKDVMPYIQAWTCAIGLILTMLIYRLWRFGKKYPQIFQPDTTADDKRMLVQKSELRRRYNNKSMLAFFTMFVWMIGIMVICFSFGRTALTGNEWFISALALLIILLLLLMTRRNSEK